MRRKYTNAEKKLMKEVRENSHICHYCGKLVKEEDKSVDHKTSLYKGGKTIADNLVMCCKECNRDKNDLDEQTYIKAREYINNKLTKDLIVKSIQKSKEIYKRVVDEINKDSKELEDAKAKIKEVQQCIMNAKMSACDGYKLAKKLQGLLIKQEELRVKVNNNNPSKVYAITKIEELEKDEQNLRNKYKQEFLKNNKIN